MLCWEIKRFVEWWRGGGSEEGGRDGGWGVSGFDFGLVRAVLGESFLGQTFRGCCVLIVSRYEDEGTYAAVVWMRCLEY